MISKTIKEAFKLLKCGYCFKKLSQYEIDSILIHFFKTQLLECEECYDEIDEDTIPKENKYDSK